MAERRAFLAAAVMTGAAVLGQMRPRPHRPAGWQALELQKAIPDHFGDWQVDSALVPLQVSPDVAAMLEKIYTQQLSRTYVNAGGQRVMLLIAYGPDQLELTTQAHLPDVCYPAQGFDILERSVADLPIPGGALPVARLVAQAPGRTEPLTYWITMGDMVLRDEMQRRLERMRLTLRGIIADGMLVRVSSIDADVARAYRGQEDFIRDLHAALEASVANRVYGAPLRART